MEMPVKQNEGLMSFWKSMYPAAYPPDKFLQDAATGG